MVKKLSPQIKEAVAQAIADAERRTTAEVAMVIVPASDAYQSQVMLYGLLLGSLTAVGLWFGKIVTGFPQLLAIQFCCMALVLFVPLLRNLSLKLVPKQVMRHRASKSAYAEYIFVSRHMPAGTPVVLFYVSLAEKYVHIVHSRIVAEKIPQEIWDNIVREFTVAVKTSGLKEASITAIGQIANALVPHFPEPV